MKKDEKSVRLEQTESWKICSSPTVAAFVFALASMVFSGEFERMLHEGQWGYLIVWVCATWFGFFIFWVAVCAVFDQLEEKIPKKLKRFSKWFVAAVAVVVFVILYYVIHYII